MFGNCENFNPVRQYVQFNDLVFDSTDVISEASYKQSTKTETEEYSYGHGNYVNFKSSQQFLTEGDLSMTINIDYRKYRREERKYLKDFIKLNLIKAGRIWAIEDNKILWAYAYVTDFSDDYYKFKGHISFDIELKLYEGVWHIADPRRTYLIPYSTCNFLECYDFRDDTNCGDCCVNCVKPMEEDCASCLCHCDDLVKENSLCVIGRNILDEFMRCGESFLLVYDCKRSEEFFGEDSYGKKIYKADVCKSTIAGQFYSGTILDTTNIDIRIEGKFQNPEISINGNRIRLIGDYDGTITIDRSGSVMYSKGDCCPFEEVDLNNVEILDDFLFTVKHGMNNAIVKNSCCEMASIYIYVYEITY